MVTQSRSGDGRGRWPLPLSRRWFFRFTPWVATISRWLRQGGQPGGDDSGWLPVPPGFVVATAAYERFVADNRLAKPSLGRYTSSQLAAPASGWLRGGADSVGGPAGPFGRVPPSRAWPSGRALQRDGEDLPEAAFAGQPDSFLNVVSQNALLEAVRRCWASLWSDRAIDYRFRQGSTSTR